MRDPELVDAPHPARRRTLALGLLVSGLLATGLVVVRVIHRDAGSAPPAAPSPPATVEGRQRESELARVTLSPEAEKRLDVRTARIESRAIASERSHGGEIIAPTGAAGSMAAPVAGTAPERSSAAG